jgi:hypothetical protein
MGFDACSFLDDWFEGLLQLFLLFPIFCNLGLLGLFSCCSTNLGF